MSAWCCGVDALMKCHCHGSQALASLSLVSEDEAWQRAYSPPQTELQLPEALPRLRRLQFGSYCNWDAMCQALWPLAILAAHSTRGHDGGSGASRAHAVGVSPFSAYCYT